MALQLVAPDAAVGWRTTERRLPAASAPFACCRHLPRFPFHFPVNLDSSSADCRMAASAGDFQVALDKAAQHLTSDDPKAVAAATVTLTLILQHTQLPADLSTIVERLAELLDNAELAVQRNTAAALAACLESSDTAVQAAIETRVVRCIKGAGCCGRNAHWMVVRAMSATAVFPSAHSCPVVNTADPPPRCILAP